MANEIIASNSSIVHTGFSINQLYTLANSPAEIVIYVTGPNQYLDLTWINNQVQRSVIIRSLSDISNTSVIASINPLSSVNVFNTANKLIVPPNYVIFFNGGSAITNQRLIIQGTSFSNSP